MTSFAGTLDGHPAHATRLRRWGPWLCWTAVAVFTLVLLDAQRAPSTFWYGDEWSFVQHRRGWSLHGFVEPHLGHLVAVPVLLYRLLFSVVGLTHYRPFRVMGVAAHLAVATSVFAYGRARVGTLVALCGATAIALLGSGFQCLYFPFTVNLTLALAGSVFAWLALDRCTTRGDAGACGLHTLAVCCSGIGAAGLVGSACRFAVAREWRRAVRVLALPSGVFFGWYLVWGRGHTRGGVDNLPRIPRYATEMVSAGAGGLFGRDQLWGHVLLGVIVGVLALQRRRVLAAAAPLGMLLATALLIAWSRADLGEPNASRYAYILGVLLLLALSDVAPRPLPPSTRYVAPLLCVLSVWGNWAVLIRGALGLRTESSIVAHEIRAVEWARHTVDAGFEPDHRRAPFLFAGTYLAAVDDLGSPAAGDAEVLAGPETTRQLVDLVSVAALGVFDHDLQPPAPLACTDVDSATERPLTVGALLEVRAGDAPVEIRLRRLAGEFAADATHVVDVGDASTFAVPADDAPVGEWFLRISSAAPYAVCE